MDENAIDELLSRGVEEVLPDKETLKKRLMSGEKLRIKLGIDPTSPNLHVGRSVTLLKLADFQKLGHQVIFIVGDFTGLIGDTSDKDAERPMLEEAVLEKNKQEYFAQVENILDIKKTELKYNSEWLRPLTYKDIGEQADLFSVSDFISRDLIKRRLDEGKRVSLREVLYPLMQGYDSVAVKADVEIGGTDQRFNLLAGRPMQEKYGQRPQHVMTLGPLLPGTDGRKMSSSWGNTINLRDTPTDMFGKVMSIPDALVEQYATLATRLPMDTVRGLKDMHPKDAKMLVAEELVRMYHGADSASAARKDFDSTFSKGGVPDVVQEVLIGAAGLPLMDALVQAGIVPSKSEYRRLLSAGAIRIVGTDEKITEDWRPVMGTVLRIGKHHFVKIK
ncbi:MAG: tyrosyl-tRNA synthetase, tyrosyl-tRNA synthetase [Candidatus Parcubacteria bacterium]|jgi:tyrosyl-tRNA synthetase